MDSKVPFLHEHNLVFDKYLDPEATCDKCHQKIYDTWTYQCEKSSCYFWLHGLCVEQQFPRQISHPGHPQHLLSLKGRTGASICSICRNLFRGYYYCCHDCDFKVDIFCASDPHSEILLWEKQIMEVQPFLHQHHLLFDYYENEEATCDKCHRKIQGCWAYNCESCDFWLEFSCAEQQLPPKISHPAHSQHLLTRSTTSQSRAITFSICDICFTNFKGHVYICRGCDFKVDVLCASESEGEKLEKFEDRYDFKHFIHKHPLTLFNYRKARKDESCCTWCGKFLSGMCYTCDQCDFRSNVFLHRSCLFEIPLRIFEHHFHPSHPLHIQRSSDRCNTCDDYIDEPNAYICQKCDFSLHILCAGLKPTLKSNFHEHPLTYIPINPKKYLTEVRATSQCKRCYADHIDIEYGNFYRCVPCNINFHMDCIPIPLTTTINRYHRHDLTFIQSFNEDNSGEYYCDVCEEERNSEYPIYYCKECPYFSHIHCALNEVDSEALIPKVMWQEQPYKKTDPKSQSDHLEHETEVFFHQHPLIFFEVKEDNEDCAACRLKISGEGYRCESCKYYLHKTCTKLPLQIPHPDLQPQHSLNLLANTSEEFTCHECRRIAFGYGYVCYHCNFKLDVKCALNLTPTDEDQRLKWMKTLSKYCPFNLDHKLQVKVFDDISHSPGKYMGCSVCLLPLKGPVFHCKVCDYNIHEPCLELPSEIEVPVHPEHPLHPELRFDYESCQVCGRQTSFFPILYTCQDHRRVRLHLPCANSLKRAIIVKRSYQSYPHYLFYFEAKWQEVFSKMTGGFFKCDANGCGESLEGMAFYHCLIYGFNIHLKCVPIPDLIESKFHIHPFTLKDEFKEDDSGDHYCDVCEEERNGEDHVYYCEQCAFVAHIECVLKQVEVKTTLMAETYSNLDIDVQKLPFDNRWTNNPLNRKRRNYGVLMKNRIKS